jgi:hypothetical protein
MKESISTNEQLLSMLCSWDAGDIVRNIDRVKNVFLIKSMKLSLT